LADSSVAGNRFLSIDCDLPWRPFQRPEKAHEAAHRSWNWRVRSHGSAGVAAAAEYDGQTYADAAAAIEESGGTPVVATRVGSQLPQDDCLVVNSQDHSYLRDPPDDVYVLSVTDEVRLNLNCAGGYAT